MYNLIYYKYIPLNVIYPSLDMYYVAQSNNYRLIYIWVLISAFMSNERLGAWVAKVVKVVGC